MDLERANVRSDAVDFGSALAHERLELQDSSTAGVQIVRRRSGPNEGGHRPIIADRAANV
jgi:hypothetical protein